MPGPREGDRVARSGCCSRQEGALRYLKQIAMVLRIGYYLVLLVQFL